MYFDTRWSALLRHAAWAAAEFARGEFPLHSRLSLLTTVVESLVMTTVGSLRRVRVTAKEARASQSKTILMLTVSVRTEKCTVPYYVSRRTCDINGKNISVLNMKQVKNRQCAISYGNVKVSRLKALRSSPKASRPHRGTGPLAGPKTH